MSLQAGRSAHIVRGNVSNALLEAALLLGIGFYMRLTGFHGFGDSQLFIRSVDAVVWTFLVGGFLVLGVALACLTGRPWA